MSVSPGSGPVAVTVNATGLPSSTVTSAIGPMTGGWLLDTVVSRRKFGPKLGTSSRYVPRSRPE